MGTDKSQLQWGKTSLAELAYSKLTPYCDKVYFSINEDQQNLGLQNPILDNYTQEGPLTGIISAMRATEQSLMVVAVDMPLITSKTLERLLEHRDWDLLSTTHYNKKEGFWQPFPSIWEIEALPCLEEYFNSGERSFQKFLNKFGHQQVPMEDSKEFMNLNTIEEYEKLLTLQNQSSE
ncbi:MAG: hypothetical protein COA58_11120 [Bacteroidetes bacterium]|nr:MAG: hypothetical protein COA58_11120 [Bacteroidota bacterium]